MSTLEWMDKAVLKIVTAAVFLGTSAAALRGLKEKETAKSFIIRILTGALMSGCLSYIIRDLEMPSFIWGVIIFAAGYSSAEMGALIAKLGKKKVEDKIDDDAK